ncbi:hypothetical protein OPIT5_23085 [Opitutaceae bacterium TAV5]|nr:hypothetical protein OPIT5_23085 [Opitutaceae bacterium TAV5]
MSTVPGWSLATGSANTATVSLGTGYGGGNSSTITANEGYGLTLSGGNVMTAADGPLEFKLNFKSIASTDAYQQSIIMIAENGGVNGLAIQFNGGTQNGKTDNYIQVSSGTGTSWGGAGLSVIVPDSAWETGRWYEVTFRFELKSTGIGQDVSGLLSVYDTVTSSFLVQDIVIGGIGSTGGAFDKVNVVQVKNNGTARAFEVSDIRIGTAAVPEPAITVLLAGLSVLGLVALRSRLQKKPR